MDNEKKKLSKKLTVPWHAHGEAFSVAAILTRVAIFGKHYASRFARTSIVGSPTQAPPEKALRKDGVYGEFQEGDEKENFQIWTKEKKRFCVWEKHGIKKSTVTPTRPLFSFLAAVPFLPYHSICCPNTANLSFSLPSLIKLSFVFTILQLFLSLFHSKLFVFFWFSMFTPSFAPCPQ